MERDLFAWILGGALITTGAIAAAIQFNGHSQSPAIAPRTSPAPSAGAGSGLAVSVPAAAALPPPSAAPAAPAVAAPPQPPAATASLASPASELPTGEVWECVVNGQKVFSDKRCGIGASVKQLGDLNVMHPPLVPPQTSYGMYPPGYAGAAYPPAPSYPDDQDDAGNVSSDFYPGQQIIAARERTRREHLSRDNRARPSPPNRGTAGSHNSR
jgi:hypothetical protein